MTRPLPHWCLLLIHLALSTFVFFRRRGVSFVLCPISSTSSSPFVHLLLDRLSIFSATILRPASALFNRGFVTTIAPCPSSFVCQVLSVKFCLSSLVCQVLSSSVCQVLPVKFRPPSSVRQILSAKFCLSSLSVKFVCQVLSVGFCLSSLVCQVLSVKSRLSSSVCQVSSVKFRPSHSVRQVLSIHFLLDISSCFARWTDGLYLG